MMDCLLGKNVIIASGTYGYRRYFRYTAAAVPESHMLTSVILNVIPDPLSPPILTVNRQTSAMSDYLLASAWPSPPSKEQPHHADQNLDFF